MKEFTAKQVIDMYKQGYTNVEVAEELELTKREFTKLCQTNTFFRELVERGNDIAEAWNERQGRLALRDRDFNTAVWKARMGQHFGWSDRIEQNTRQLSVTAEMTREELLKRIQSLAPELLSLPAPLSANEEAIDHGTE